MADATILSVPLETWTQATTSSTIATIYNKDINYKYYQTYVDTGEDAPAAISGGVVPTIAVEMFKKRDRELIISSAGIDIYICTFKAGFEAGSGTVRVDY